MKKQRFITLLVVTVIVVITAALLSTVRAPQTTREKELLFPRLEAAINDITGIELTGYDSEVRLARQGEGWVLAGNDNYPADFDKVRALIIGFANFRVLAEKTRRPHLYPRLSVENPDTKGSRAIVTRLYNSAGDEVAALIIGREKTGNAANPFPGFYGRIPDTETSLLLQGQPDVSADPRDWFETGLFSIASDRVSEVRIEHADSEPVLLQRSDPGQADFQLQNIPEGKKAQSLVIINRMGALLEDMVAMDVRALNTVNWPGDTVTTRVSTFDGLVVTMKLAALDGQPFANFRFEKTSAAAPASASDSEAAALNADELNRRHADWVYLIQDFKFRDLTRTMDDLVRNQ